jgi:diaminopimelate epimerase
MHGLGNDFVVLDAVSTPLRLDANQVRRLADRRFGIGCDQVLIAEPPTSADEDFFYRIFNADGSQAEQCGNGARCIARFVRMRGLTDKTQLVFRTLGGPIETSLQPNGNVSVVMGRPRFEPAEIPLKAMERATTYRFDLSEGTVEFAALSMGNPHAVIAVPDIDDAPVERLGAALQADARFPASVNVGFMEILDRQAARLRVYERGAGETLACGSGACAAAVAGRIWGLLDERVSIELKGGRLMVEWLGKDAAVIMTGPAVTVFEGAVEL